MPSQYLPGYESTLNSLTKQCGIWNTNLKFIYLSYFNNEFLVGLWARPAQSPTTPKAPPASWVVTGTLPNPDAVDDDTLLSAIYNMSVAQTGGPVCEEPVYSAPTPVARGWFHAG